MIPIFHEERCVSCGRVIPEGRQSCPICEKKPYNAAEFFHLRKRTNYDRLRGASMEEMAVWLCALTVRKEPKDWLEWLRKEAEE